VGADAQFAKPDLQMLSEKVLELIHTGKVKTSVSLHAE
jgi:hypothetical protein